MYHQKSPYTVYCERCYHSDSWDSYSYGFDFKPKLSFLTQLNKLFTSVPQRSVYISATTGPNINSEYTNMSGGNKDCYLIFNSGPCKNVMYSRGLIHCRDSTDLYFGSHVEHCYEGVNIQRSTNIVYGQNVSGSLHCIFDINLRGCSNCFGCINLQHKSYHFFNKQISKEDWQERVKKVMGSYKKIQEAKQQFKAFVLSQPRKENSNLKAFDFSGDYLFETKNVQHSFEVTNAEDCKYLTFAKKIKDSYDVLGYGFQSESLLEACGCWIFIKGISHPAE